MEKYILSLKCPDQGGVVAAISQHLFSSGFNILESHQFTDQITNIFCMRIVFNTINNEANLDQFTNLMDLNSNQFSIEFNIHDVSKKKNILIMCSLADHCLLDLLYRIKLNEINAEPVAILSNHKNLLGIATEYKVPYQKINYVINENAYDEKTLEQLIEVHNPDLIVLARYMQIISPDICREYEGRIINIHHSFLPAFKGSGPYKQAYQRGVKLIGATAHFVTSDLDEGPIISQGVTEVSHSKNEASLKSIGRDIEKSTLSKAVKLFCEDRIFLCGGRTIIFD
jgi:formyltetrahydrofolate deformylase